MATSSAPFKLASFDTDTRKWQITEEATRILSGLTDKPVRSVGIVGELRQGKSYIITRFAGEQKGFEVSSGVLGKTRGVWAWFPQKLNNASATELTMLLDSEGLADAERADPTYDSQVMTLMTLLSSELLYNIKGSPTEYHITTIANSTAFTRDLLGSILPPSGAITISDVDRRSVWPRLTLLARDFNLELAPGCPDKAAWLQKLLCHRQVTESAAVVAKEIARQANTHRDQLTSTFTGVYLNTVSRPVTDPLQEKLLCSLSDAELRPAFVSECSELISAVKGRLQVKRVLTSVNSATGSATVALTPQLIQALASKLMASFTSVSTAAHAGFLVTGAANEVARRLLEEEVARKQAAEKKAAMEEHERRVAALRAEQERQLAALQHNMDGSVAFQITTYDREARKWHMTAQAIEIFGKLQPEKRIRSVGVAGPMREGKSYLMSRFGGSQKGFELGSTTDSKTKGIWGWLPPNLNEPGSSMYTLLIDTEGLSDPDHGDPKFDAEMFVMATLLSSVLIYNFLGVPNERKIRELSFAAQMTEHVAVKQGAPASSEDFKSIFPRLIFVARDFHLEFPPDTPTPNAYIMSVLKRKEVPPRATPLARMVAEEANKIRQAILEMFPNVQFVPLSVPVGDPLLLRRVDELPEAHIRAEFLHECQSLIDDVLAHAGPRQILLPAAPGQSPSLFTLTPRGLSAVIQGLLKAFNDGVVPHIASEVEAASEIVCGNAADAASDYARQAIAILEAGPLPRPSETLIAELQPVIARANQMFADQAMGNSVEKHRARLTASLESMQQHIRDLNFAKSKLKCETLFRGILDQLEKELNSGKYVDFDTFKLAAGANLETAIDNAGELGPALSDVTAAMGKHQEDLLQLAMTRFQLEAAKREQLLAEEREKQAQQKCELEEQRKKELEAEKLELQRQTQEQLAKLAAKIEEQGKAHTVEMRYLQEQNAKQLAEMAKQHLEAVNNINRQNAEAQRQAAERFANQQAEANRQHTHQVAQLQHQIAAARQSGGRKKRCSIM